MPIRYSSNSWLTSNAVYQIGPPETPNRLILFVQLHHHAADSFQLSAAPDRVFYRGCVQRAELRAPPPGGRALSLRSSLAPFKFRTPPAKASLGPLPQNFLGRLGSGSRRHTLRASMYRTQREIPQQRSYTNVQSHTSHRPHRSRR